MLTEGRFNKDLLRKKIEELYEIKVNDLKHVKGGMASWGYKATTDTEEYFVKIHKDVLKADIRFELSNRLYNAGIKNITNPIKNINNELTFPFDTYQTALFKFIPGHNASERPMTKDEKFSIGILLGKIHTAKINISDLDLKEDFIYGNVTRLQDALIVSEGFLTSDVEYKRKTAMLLLENKDKILKRIELMENLGKELRGSRLELVPCHGEPHKWNTMIADTGEVFLIDWDDSLIAPKEKDLNTIKDDEEIMKGYRSIVENSHINKEVLDYYNLEWNISEIDAWSNSLFYEDTNEIEQSNNLKELISDLEELNN